MSLKLLCVTSRRVDRSYTPSPSRPKRTSMLVPIFEKKGILWKAGANSRNQEKWVFFSGINMRHIHKKNKIKMFLMYLPVFINEIDEMCSVYNWNAIWNNVPTILSRTSHQISVASWNYEFTVFITVHHIANSNVVIKTPICWYPI